MKDVGSKRKMTGEELAEYLTAHGYKSTWKDKGDIPIPVLKVHFPSEAVAYNFYGDRARYLLTFFNLPLKKMPLFITGGDGREFKGTPGEKSEISRSMNIRKLISTARLEEGD